MEIKILGSCCKNCEKLQQLTERAVAELGIDTAVQKVTDMGEIMAFGVLSIPALVIDGDVRLSGRVPAYEDLKGLLERAM